MNNSTKNITLILAALSFIAVIHSSFAAKNSSKQSKMEEKIKQQQDTIDLLTLKLEKNSPNLNANMTNNGMKDSAYNNNTMIKREPASSHLYEIKSYDHYKAMPNYELSYP